MFKEEDFPKSTYIRFGRNKHSSINECEFMW